MLSALSERGHFEPIHAAHAIDQVAFIVQFDRPVGDAVFKEIDGKTESLNQNFPARTNYQAMGFSIQNGEPPVAPPALTTGILLRKMEPDASVAIELRVEQASLTFITTRYTRWAEILAQVKIYFDALLPVYLKTNVRLRSVGLNYIDKFAWSGAKDSFSLDGLIKRGSKYIASHVFEAEDLWHSHSGAFSREDDFIKRLLNVNIDCFDAIRQKTESRVVGITTVIADQFNQVGYDEYAPTGDKALDNIYLRMQNMHDFGKSVLSDIITTEMSRRIALQGE